MTVFTNGNVSVPGNFTNTGSLVASGGLTVSGTAKVGNNQIAGGVESLRIIRGEIAGAGGTIDFGSGFSVTKNSTGDFTINYSSGFAGTPAFTATSFGSLVIPELFISTSTSCQIQFFNPAGTKVDPAGFDFIAVGP